MNFEVNRKQAEEVSKIFKSFSQVTRLLILCRLSKGPASVLELQEACGLDQAPTSQFLARLRREGRIQGERVGNQVFYTLTDERLTELMQHTHRLFCEGKPESRAARSGTKKK